MSCDPGRFDLLHLHGHPRFVVHRLGAHYTTFDNLTRGRSTVRGSGTVEEMGRLLIVESPLGGKKQGLHISRRGNVPGDITHVDRTGCYSTALQIEKYGLEIHFVGERIGMR